jgi:hypothetical protein
VLVNLLCKELARPANSLYSPCIAFRHRSKQTSFTHWAGTNHILDLMGQSQLRNPEAAQSGFMLLS